ncbi:MAG: hypothetical protein ACOC5M_02065 [Chloroflexota bacterium]
MTTEQEQAIIQAVATDMEEGTSTSLERQHGVRIQGLHDLLGYWLEALRAQRDTSPNVDAFLYAWDEDPGHISSAYVETGVAQMVRGWIDIAAGWEWTHEELITDDRAGAEWARAGARLLAMVRELRLGALGTGMERGSQPIEWLIEAALRLMGRDVEGGPIG